MEGCGHNHKQKPLLSGDDEVRAVQRQEVASGGSELSVSGGM